MGYLPRICLRGKVFIGPLPSNGYMRNTYKTPCGTGSIVACALPRNGSTCHNIQRACDMGTPRIFLYENGSAISSRGVPEHMFTKNFKPSKTSFTDHN
jgi:hypothetical protein